MWKNNERTKSGFVHPTINALSEKEDKNKLYEQKKTVMIIMGDAKAKVGRQEMYKDVIGKYTKHEESNDDGLRIFQLDRERNMKIKCSHL